MSNENIDSYLQVRGWPPNIFLAANLGKVTIQ